MNFKHRLLPGAIIVLAAALFVVVLSWLTGSSFFLSSYYPIKVKFDSVTGLKEHAQVFLRGYRIGWTGAVQFEDDGITVTLEIRRSFRVPRDSQVEINTLNLLGEKVINITPGKASAVLQANERIAGRNKDVMNDAKNVLSLFWQEIKEKQLDQDFSDTLHQLAQSLQQLNMKIAVWDTVDFQRQISHLGTASAQIAQFLTQNREGMAKVVKDSSPTLAHIEQTVAKMDLVLVGLDRVLAKLNSQQGSAGELINDREFLRQFQETMRNLNMLVLDIKKNPGRYFRASLF